MITLNNISKSFATAAGPVVALDEVSLTVERGRIYGVIGYSGAGKSTLIRVLNGLERVDRGSIFIGDLDITKASERQLRRARPKIGMIFQHFNLLWSRTVARNIAFALEVAGARRANIADRVAELVKLVGLQGREDAYPSQLSGGQKQRVGIARALANRPDVLLCDEATSALDPDTTDSILDLLVDVNRRLGLTIVLITHEMYVVRRICDQVAVMEEGRIVESGPVADIFARPRLPVTQRFVRQVSKTETAASAFDPARVDIEGGAVVKLVFVGPQVLQPVLAQAVRRFDLLINIVHGRLTHEQDPAVGEFYIHVPAQGEELAEVLAHFTEAGVETKIVRGE